MNKPVRYKTKTYKAWENMRSRCNNPNANLYKNYGGRGIKVDPTWNSFDNFLRDMGKCPEGCSLDRINVNRNYNKENCRWATREMQDANRTNNVRIVFMGITKNLAEWAVLLKIAPKFHPAFRKRIQIMKWGLVKAATTPLQKQGRKKGVY